MKFKVRLLWTDVSTYVVEAPNAEEAAKIAKKRFNDGDNGTTQEAIVQSVYGEIEPCEEERTP